MAEPALLNDRYRLDERLGSGGMAVVYRAWDLTLERTVAIKVLRQDYSDTPEFRQRFRHEARAAAGLSHPNIATIHDFGLDQDRLFIVMEYVPGQDLKTLLQAKSPLEVADAMDLILQACSGLGHAHRSGLVHCDVKPQNLLVTPDRQLKIVDFGIARALATISPTERSEVVWGSPQYFSPEQASGLPPSPASDVYSLGVVLYEMLTGRLPFTAASADELALQHREAPPPSPGRYNPSIPAALEKIVLRVLAKEPAQRFRTANQLGQALNSLGQPAYAPPPTPTGNTQARTSPPTAPPIAAPSIKPQSAPTVAPLHTPPIQPPASTAARPAAAIRSNSPEIEWPQPAQPATASQPVRPAQPANPDLVVISPPQKPESFDWLSWTLALLAFIIAGGLVPFWLWVLYMVYRP